MAANVLTTGTNTTPSSGVTVAAGTPVTFGLKAAADVPPSARVLIEVEDDGAAWRLVGELNAYEPVKCIAAPGTYRFTRAAGSESCGVFSA